MPLHVLAGVPEAERKTVASLLGSEPQLWSRYGAWLSLNEPSIWQEVLAMAAQQGLTIPLDLRPLTEYLRQGGRLDDLKSFLEAVGVKQAVEAVGVKQAVEAVGAERFWKELSPEQREELRRLAQQDKPSDTADNT